MGIEREGLERAQTPTAQRVRRERSTGKWDAAERESGGGIAQGCDEPPLPSEQGS